MENQQSLPVVLQAMDWRQGWHNQTRVFQGVDPQNASLVVQKSPVMRASHFLWRYYQRTA